MFESVLDKVIKDKNRLAKIYSVPVSAIIWTGNNHYIIIKSGEEIKI